MLGDDAITQRALRAVQLAISSDGVNETHGRGRCRGILMKLSTVGPSRNFYDPSEREKKCIVLPATVVYSASDVVEIRLAVPGEN